MTVTFTEPTDDGGADITGYQVTATPDGAVAECASSPCEVLGLTNGTSYTFTVTALHQAGLSHPSDPSSAVTPATVPGAPTAVGVQRGDQSATVTFGAPADDGGSTITGYEISLDDGDTWTSLTTTGDTELTATIDGLTNGTTYDVSVRAVNEIGAGEAASDLAVTRRAGRAPRPTWPRSAATSRPPSPSPPRTATAPRSPVTPSPSPPAGRPSRATPARAWSRG